MNYSEDTGAYASSPTLASPSGSDGAASGNNKSRPRPPPLAALPLNGPLAAVHGQEGNSAPPLSPAVVLSPSTPDFPTGQLALPDVHELLVPARELPRSMTPPLRQLEDDLEAGVQETEVLGADEGEEERDGAKRVRESLMLLDSKLAEIQLLGFGTVSEDPAAGNNVALSGEQSMSSLASFATNTTTTSSEDAFDIADFPAVGPLELVSDETDLASIPRPRRSSSNVMAFPAPPALSSVPSTARPSVSASANDDGVFQQLAQLGQRPSVQGLGLFPGDDLEAHLTAAGASDGRSSRSSSVSEASTLSDKSFDASTLASSAANTSCGPRDVEEFPPALPAQAAQWFATSPPTSTPRALPSTIGPSLADLGGSAHPALASPFVVDGAEDSPALGGLSYRANSPATQYSARSSSLPVQRSRSSSRATISSPSPRDEVFPGDPVTAAPMTAAPFVMSPELQAQELELLAEDLKPAIPRKDQTATEARSPKVPPSPAASFGKTLRRLSSFGLLKKRKSEAVLRDSAGSRSNENPVAEPAPDRIPQLSKRKSEAALSALLLRSSQQGADKENSGPSRSVSPRPHPPAKLARRSVSTPKLAAKFAAPGPPPRGESPRPPPLPTSSASFAGQSPASTLAARQRTSSFSEWEQSGTGRLKKRLSAFFNNASPRMAEDEAVPPVPPTPTEHLVAAAKGRAPVPMGIDVARANGLMIREESEPLSACTLDTASPMRAASVFSEALPSSKSSPATSAAPTPSRYAAAAGLKDKPVPVLLPTACLSAPAHQQGFLFPAAPSLSDVQDSRMSLYGFMRASDDLAPSAATAAESAGAIFPTTRLAQERSAVRQAFREGHASPSMRAETMAFPPQDLIAFPVRIQHDLQRALPSTVPLGTSPGTLNSEFRASDQEEDASEDEYGSNTEGDSDEDDKPLGIVVPGALTVQKSLRLTAAKKSRSERKAREAQGPTRRREDPFELEHAAAMVSTPPGSYDGHGARAGPSSHSRALPHHVRPPLSPIASASTVATLQSAGHDALLPQSDASLDRRSGSGAMHRSPSIPLDPMVANSALTIDSPEVAHEPLPGPFRNPFSLPSPKRETRQAKKSGLRKPEGMSVATTLATAPPVDAPLRSPISLGPPPKPTFRPPPVPASSSSAIAPDRRPSLATRSSSSPRTSPAGTPSLSRRPSLHPDLHPSAAAMMRQASSSSAASTLATVSRSGTLSSASRSRSGTASSAQPHTPAVETRVYVDAACEQFLRVNVTDKTLAGEVVAFAKAKGVLAKEIPGTAEGGWALWEAWRSTGIERPVREYELVADVTRSWDQEGNVLFLRRTTMWPILSTHARPHPPAPKSGPIQLEVKAGKWSKRFLTLKDGALSYSKTDKGKDATVLCQMSNFDVFLVSAEQASRLKAPRPFVFALKSRLTRAHFEETAEWCHFVATKTPEEAASWVKCITEAGNPYARIREQAVLGASGPTSPTSGTFPAVSLLASTAPPVPPIPSSVPALRNPSARPMPPSLVQRSNTAPLPPAVGPGASLSRAATVVKPDARQWGAMGHEERQEWLVASERAAKQAKQPLLDLSR